MEQLADLHIHTNFSDSTSSPKEVIEQAVKAKLCCISITDHDTVDGIEPAIQAAEGTGLEIISGIELSTAHEGKDIHMLAYLFDHTNSKLLDSLRGFQDARVERAAQIIDKLKELGIDNITLEEVCAKTQSDSVGRPHIAAALVEKKWVKDIKKAFDKYLGDGGPAYVPKFKLSPFDAVRLIRESGGVAVMAHPMITNRDNLIPELVKAGMQGIEVYYANCPNNVIHYYEGIAQKYNLIMTGGSDAHGKAKKNTWLAKSTIPYELVEKLKTRQKENVPGLI